MLNTRPLLHFLIIFLLSYVALMVIGTMTEEGYAKRFRAFGKTFFSDFTNGMVWFEKFNDSKEKHFNTKIRLINKQQYKESQQKKTPLKTGAVEASSWYTGFLPTILVISLILASPISWKRRGIALLWGLLLVHIYIWFELYIQILYEFDRNEFLHVVSFSTFWQKVMDGLHYLFVTSMGTTFIVPVFLWLAATFRKGDLEKILKK